MDEEKIAQGTYDFRVMREKGYRYVDKTALLYPLVTRDGDAFFFISRPRRFGKSLMLSTLAYLFQGRRDLFKGLAIDRMDYDWESYPILHFNFGTMDVTTFDSFYSAFVARVMQAFKEAKVTYDPAFAPGDNFANAIRSLAQDRGKPVVILIDEYDAPVGAALNDIKKAEAIRAKLSAFYGEIKNNVGNRWYNGYRFSPDCEEKVYNPFAIGQTLGALKRRFIGTWIATGQTSAVINYFTNNQLAERDYENVEGVTEEDLDVCGLENIRPTAMLYQSGYLTIKDFRDPYFTLGFPDEEVRRAFNTQLVQKFTETKDNDYRNLTCLALMKGDVVTFLGRLSDLYAHLAYGPQENSIHEFSYQRILYVLLTSDGSFRVTAEDRQSHGRADLVAETPERVFVFELKVDGTPQEALDQIKEKGYADPYRHSGKEVHLIGLSFDGATRRLTGTATEPLT